MFVCSSWHSLGLAELQIWCIAEASGRRSQGTCLTPLVAALMSTCNDMPVV